MESAIRNPQSTILIVGQGLAGTALAWRLWERGTPFLIVDPNEAETASKIAAGLVTPVTGQRLNLSWRIYALLPEALEFYRHVEEKLGAKFYHPTDCVRLLNDDREAAWWEERKKRGELLPWLRPEDGAPLVSEEHFHGERGGFVQKNAGWLDTAAYLQSSRDFFKGLGCLRELRVEEEELEPTDDAVQWRGESFATVVFCRGWREQEAQRFFPWLKFGSARGVVASLKAELSEQRIINRGAWLLPRGPGEWRAGSTYEFDLSRPMEESIAELREKLGALLRGPFEIGEAQRAVRPIIKHRPLILGRHPAQARVCVLNGLGSKGVLRAPFFARMLVEHLLDDKPLEPVVDVRSND
jgi:glycine oxidase